MATTTSTTPTTTTAAAPSKKHVQKLDDFTEVKDTNKFKRQLFVYISEYATNLNTDKKKIHFALSFIFMKGGLPEKFAANFIDQVIKQTTDPKDWGTVTAFDRLFNEFFKDKNKKSNAENQIARV